MNLSASDVDIALSLLQLQRLPSPSPSPPPEDRKRKMPPPIQTDFHSLDTPRLGRRRLSEFESVQTETVPNKKPRCQLRLSTTENGSLQIVGNPQAVPSADAVRRYLEIQERKLMMQRSRLPSPTSPVESKVVIASEGASSRRVQVSQYHDRTQTIVSSVPRRVHQQLKSELKKRVRTKRVCNLESDYELADITSNSRDNAQLHLAKSRMELKDWMCRRVKTNGPNRTLIETKFAEITL